MYKVTRVFMGSVGHVLAWYPGIDVPLTDLDGQPTHTIFNLVNQGGKSTFLSMFFTLFDPDKGRFLQHLRNNAQRFDQYFDKDGLPGLVAVEWMLPGDLASERKLVTGLIVVMKKSGELFEPDRHFFAFESVPGLSYDDLPHEEMRGGAAGVLGSREDAMRWLQQMDTTYPGNFQRFSNQNEWRACLESRGIDVEMLRRQVEFNRTEGGMGDAFLDFRTESDFVRKFMTLTVNPETATQTHDTVSTLCRRMHGRGRLVDAQRQLERFSQLFDPFARAAADYHEASKERSTIEAALAQAYATFEVRAATQRQGAEAAKRNTLEFRAAGRRAGELQKQNAGMAEAYGEAILRRKKESAEASEKSTKEAHAELSHTEQLMHAALLQSEILECHTRVKTIQQSIDQVTAKKLAPLRAERNRTATLCNYAISVELDIIAQQVDELAARLESLTGASESLKSQESALRVARESALKELSHVKGQMESAEKSLKRLRDTGVVQEFETSDDARERLATALEEAQALGEDVERQMEDTRATLDELTERRASRKNDIELNRVKVSNVRERIGAGEAQRDKLSHLGVLCRAASAEVADVDSSILPVRLREFIRNAMDDLATKNLRVARLKEDRASIDETRLAGRDPDVLAIVQFLSEAGIKGVRAFPQYLAEVLPDANAARHTVLSDPARFLGVTVPREALEQARETIMDSSLKLIRPVVISSYAVKPADEREGQFTVPCADDSAFNHAAAQRRGESLTEEVEVATSRQKDAFQLYEDGRAALNELRAYTETFGDGKLAAFKADELRLIENDERLKGEVEGMDSQLQASRQRLTALGTQKKEVDKRIQIGQSQVNSLAHHLGLYEAPMRQWLETQARTVAEAQRCLEEMEACALRGLDNENQRRSVWNEKREWEAKENGWKGAQSELLPHLDDTIDIEAELAARPFVLDDIVAEYERAHLALRSAEENTTAVLTLSLTTTKKEADSKTAEYKRKYPETSYPVDTVTVFLGENIPARLALLGEQLKMTEAAEKRAFQDAAQTRADFNSFVNQRKHGDILVTGIDTLDLDALSERAVSHGEEAGRQALARQHADEMANESDGEEQRFRKNAADFDRERESIEALDLDLSVGAAVEEFLTTPQAAREFGREHERSLRKAKGVQEAARKQCDTLHQRILSLAREEEFAKVDVELAMILRENTTDSTINDYQRLAMAAQNRRDTIENELASMESDMVRGTEALLSLATDGIRILGRATDALRLPDSLPVYGGKAVLKMNTAITRLTGDQRRDGLSIYMEELCKDGNIPESGAALAAACIQRLAPNGRLDLKVLKLVSVEAQQYVPVDGLSNSGAEKISMALFLYFIIAKLRYEQRADSRLAEGGVLVLDNPFSTATARSIWESIIGLADAMKIQLLLVTGIKEYDVLSVFRRFVRLKKLGHNTTKGRIHVGIVDYQFKPSAEVEDDEELANA